MAKFKFKDVVALQIRGKKIDFVVASVRTVAKGRRAGKDEYMLAPLDNLGKTFAYRVIGDVTLLTPHGTYTEEQLEKAIAKMSGAQDEVTQHRQERKTKAIEKIRTINVGDEVKVNYHHGAKWEVVTEMRRTQVGIKSFNKSGVRWLPARVILEVRQQEKALPIEWNDIPTRRIDQMAQDGWTQVELTNGEFIVRSFVIAFNPELARRGANYDGASMVVYEDPALGIWWRGTGSFD